jgi:hypothetical protein
VAGRGALAPGLAAFAAIAAALYLGHAIAFALLTGFAAGRVAQQVFYEKTCPLGTGLILALPFTPPLLHLFASFGQGDNTFGNLSYYGGLWSRLRALGQVVEGGPGTIDGPGPEISLAILAVLLATPIALFALRLERPVLSRKTLGALAVLMAILLFTPEKLVGVQSVAARISVFVALVVGASLDWSSVRDGVKRVALLGGLAFLAIRIVVFNVEVAAHQRDIAELRGLMERIPRGARVLSANDAEVKAKANQWHVAALSVVERGNFVPNLFQGTHWLQVRERYVDSAIPQFSLPMWQDLSDPSAIGNRNYVINQNGVNYLIDWPRKFTHLLLITQPTGDVEAQLPVKLVEKGARYALYEIIDAPE